MNRKQTGWRAALLIAAAVSSVSVSRAAEPTLTELDQKVKVLERKLELADEAAAAKAKEAPVVTAGKDGFALSSADKAFQLKVRGYAQVDARFFSDDEAKKANDTFLVRRVRPILDFKVYNDFAFRLQPDFGGSGPTTQDAYGEYLGSRLFNVRVGKFKTPLGLEFLQTDSQMFFAERGLPTQLVPNRDVGVQISGDLLSVTGAVTYALGIFDGAVDGGNTDSDNNDDKDLVGRLFVHPFRLTGVDALKNFGIGVAGSVGDQLGTAAAPNLPAFRTSGQQSFFSYKTSTNATGTVYADGERVRLSPQTIPYLGPFGALAEYVLTSQDINNGKTKGSVDNESWQVQLAYVLTGEDAAFNDVTPLFNFAPSKGHWGAFELVGRYGELTIDSGAFEDYADSAKSAKSATNVGGGLNWYLNKGIKVLLDYEQTSFDGGAVKGADRPEEKVVIARAQISF